MQLTFDEGVALVAGGSGGIGAAIVRRLSGCGLPLAFTYHRGREAADALLQDCPEGRRPSAYPWGSSSFDDAAKLVEQVRKDLGPIRFLVVASGVGQQAAFHRMSEADTRRIIETNLAAVVSLTRAVVTPMMKAGSVASCSSDP